MQKIELRALFKQIRRSVFNSKGESGAYGLLENFKLFLAENQINKEDIISSYLPLNSEMNPLPTMEYLYKNSYKISVPIITKKDDILEFCSWHPDMELKIGECKTLEPININDKVIPKIVLAPLLAFDLKGYRLGMGAGYYDKTVDFLRKKDEKTILIGLGFDEQCVDELPKESYDIPLNYAITDTRIFKF
jgi:5-formyltetrahydrofolate cyclo-ligase